jgi:hypothetical protein
MNPIFSILQTLVGGLLAIAAVAATQSWTTKREMGKRRIELAEEVLALFYEAREAISAIRSPMSWAGEGDSRARTDGETEEEARKLDRAFIVIERYKRREAVFNKLRSKKYAYMASFRGESGEPFAAIDQVLNRVFVASEMLNSHYWKVQGRVPMGDAEFESHVRQMQNLEADYWQMPGDRDKLTPIIEDAIKKLEAITDAVAKEYADPPSWWERVTALPGWLNRRRT